MKMLSLPRKHPFYALIVLLLLGCITGNAQTQNTPEQEAAYTKTILDRAYKIVANLGIQDSTLFKKVQVAVADQYRALRDIHDPKKEVVKAIKANVTDKAQAEDSIKKVEAASDAQLQIQHEKYLKALNTLLSKEQVEKVKDGMTYNVLPITYKGYQEMILTLTEEQKKAIYAMLVEAREHAMDAESSDKKHWWFGKYKGRINNYLSGAGYDMKKEGMEWEKRRKEAAEAKQNAGK
jgi:Spy/CpxP family protein refolding chaperone